MKKSREKEKKSDINIQLEKTAKKEKKPTRAAKNRRRREATLKWDKLDNTAQLFPVIAREGMSNVYRVSVVLKEDIDGTALQLALEKVLPHFDIFRMTMKNGLFWHYLEENIYIFS